MAGGDRIYYPVTFGRSIKNGAHGRLGQAYYYIHVCITDSPLSICLKSCLACQLICKLMFVFFLPDRTFINFRTLKFVDLKILCSSETAIDDFSDKYIEKSSIGFLFSPFFADREFESISVRPEDFFKQSELEHTQKKVTEQKLELDLIRRPIRSAGYS